MYKKKSFHKRFSLILKKCFTNTFFIIGFIFFCILLIVSITLGVVFSVKKSKENPFIKYSYIHSAKKEEILKVFNRSKDGYTFVCVYNDLMYEDKEFRKDRKLFVKNINKIIKKIYNTKYFDSDHIDLTNKDDLFKFIFINISDIKEKSDIDQLGIKKEERLYLFKENIEINKLDENVKPYFGDYKKNIEITSEALTFVSNKLQSEEKKDAK